MQIKTAEEYRNQRARQTDAVMKEHSNVRNKDVMLLASLCWCLLRARALELYWLW